jgi:hypothetical protein
VIAIIAILAVVVVLTLNPAEMMREARDSNRLSDLATLQSAINLYTTDAAVEAASGTLGNPNIVYVSLPDPTLTGSQTSTCSSLNLPSLPTGYTYQCVSSQASRSTNGQGWLPVNLSSLSAGSPISSLPVDPTNQSSTGLYYTFSPQGSSYLVTAIPEGQKQKTALAANPEIPNYPDVMAAGTSLTASPLWNPQGLVGYWPLNEGSGTIAYDQSGNGNNGTWSGTMAGTNGTYYAQGLNGQSAGYFNGSNDYVDTGMKNLPTGNTPRSSFAWINFIAPTGEMGIYSYGTETSPNWSSLMRLTGGNLYFSGYSDDFNTSLYPSLNTWHFVGYTYDGGTSVTVYYDNQSQTANISQSLNTILYDSSIGRESAGTAFFQGFIQSVRVYNRALSAAEVQALYNAGK